MYKDPKMADVAAENLKLTAQDLYDLGVIERIRRKRKGITWRPSSGKSAEKISCFVPGGAEQLCARRYQRFRRIGADAFEGE